MSVIAGPYSIGNSNWNGLSKLIEECGEVIQVCGKIIATKGADKHWDGTNLHTRLEEELSDLKAAIEFVITQNDMSANTITRRMNKKLSLFATWNITQGGG